MYFVSAAS